MIGYGNHVEYCDIKNNLNAVDIYQRNIAANFISNWPSYFRNNNVYVWQQHS